MADNDNKELISVVVVSISLAATIIGLLVDIPQISNTTYGKTILIIIALALVGYLAYFIWSKEIRAHRNTQKRLDEIKSLLVNFTSQHADAKLEGEVDLDLINLIVDTKRMQQVIVKVTDVQHLPDNKIRIEINKGHSHGLVDPMLFKIFHNSQLMELGICNCTTALDRANLVFSLNQNCPITINEISKDSIEIRLIEPTDSSRFNTLFANLLYALDLKV